MREIKNDESAYGCERGYESSLVVAPMMGRTDAAGCAYLRAVLPRALLCTEMIAAGALVYGDSSRAGTRLGTSRAGTRLGEYFDLLALTNSRANNSGANNNGANNSGVNNSLLALQLGGCEPELLSRAIEIARVHPFCEFNLNLGCPSARVGSGGFGAFLMKDAARAASCVAAMVSASSGIRVSVKTRIGVDELDSYEHFRSFIERLHAAGCEIFYIHARKAWLHGVSPRANRNLPPLRADFVERLQAEMPRLRIFYNGGIADRAAASRAISHFGGVMVGRALWRAPYGFRSAALAEPPARPLPKSRREIALLLFAMARRNLQTGSLGNSLRLLQRAMSLYHSQPCAGEWRRFLQAQVLCLQENLRENMLMSEASNSLSEKLSDSLSESLSDNFC